MVGVGFWESWGGSACRRGGSVDPGHSHHTLQGGAERTEPGCTQQCPAAGPEARTAAQQVSLYVTTEPPAWVSATE